MPKPLAFEMDSVGKSVGPVRLFASNARLDFSELAFDSSADKDHPNRMPFTGTLLVTDKPSDQPPHGAQGHRIEVPKQVAQRRLRSLIGMGVNYDASDDNKLEGHDPQHKVGVITSAWIEGNKVKVKGNIWKKDFPESEQDIKANRSLGMSMELGDVYVRDPKEDVWLLQDFQFTGATILERESAAYWGTTLAASADRIRSAALEAASSALGIPQGGAMPNDVKDKDKPSQGDILAAAIAKGIGPAIEKSFTVGLQPLVDGLKASQDQTKDMMAAIEKLGETVAESQGNILAAIEALAGVEAGGETVDASADATKDATTDATVDAAGRGDSTQDSTQDATTDSTQDATYDAAADPKIGNDPGRNGDENPDAEAHRKSQARSGASGNQLKAQRDKNTRVGSIAAAATISRLHARAEKAEKQVASLNKKVDALQAQTEKFVARVERKSISPELSNLLSKQGYNVSEVLASGAKGTTMSIPEFDAMIERANLNLHPTDRMKLKNEMLQNGMLEDGVVNRPWMHQ